MKSNSNSFFYPALSYELLSSRSSVNKKIKEENKKKRNIK